MSTRLTISILFFAIINQVAAQPAGEHYVHIPDSPESKLALSKVNVFLKEYMQ